MPALLLTLLLGLAPQRPDLPGAPPPEREINLGEMTKEEREAREAAEKKLYILMAVGIGGVTVLLGFILKSRKQRGS